MRPLPKGAARTALTEQLAILTSGEALSISQAAAVLGGAVNESLDALNPTLDPATRANIRKTFWRHFDYNLWSLVSSLQASNQLDKIK